MRQLAQKHGLHKHSQVKLAVAIMKHLEDSFGIAREFRDQVQTAVPAKASSTSGTGAAGCDSEPMATPAIPVEEAYASAMKYASDLMAQKGLGPAEVCKQVSNTSN